MEIITKERKLEAIETVEGAGVRVRRLFPAVDLKHIDPFVLLDEFFVKSSAGFPTHPHRGFEALTYMLEGSFRHTDNLGNDTEVFPGGVQRFTAGRGIYHSEMPGEAAMNHGFQLWINLPKNLKQMEPSYEQYDPERFPERQGDGVLVRDLVGGESPVKLNTPVIYQDVHLDAGASYQAECPEGFTGLVYVYRGKVNESGTSFKAGQALCLNGERVTVEAAEPSRFIFLAGKPHGEPIRQLGPYVD